MKLVALTGVCIQIEYTFYLHFNFFIEDQNFVSMLNNFTKRQSFIRYGDNNWNSLTGFEQVVTDGKATYYAIDYGNSRIITYNHYWEYQSYQKLPYRFTNGVKYVAGYFYFSANDYFYKTDSRFAKINEYKKAYANYRQCVFDSKNSKFYVPSRNFKRIDVFDRSCSFLEFINLRIQEPSALAIYNSIIYVGLFKSNQVLVIENSLIAKSFTVDQYAEQMGISVDSFGYLAIVCYASQLIAVYDSNGNYTNTQISTSRFPHTVSTDASGRLVVMTARSLDIYY